ncbi:cation-transporting ATPase [Actinopolyspora erythraea]|uniref:Cation-transporting ATPase n=1 Tax=Actinopolyspora erythraea TaxID=414996 RepID=A0A099D966_9ACTN|nr:heavy metal-associated domain-containing protein [Actinopolyspora erythraea]ASU80360.1 cation-transporting ATPase [Actinopolyspora erythraea]KGI82559.1 cation-transporting ATPase [Actinopolyspora erythraea]
MPTQTFKVAGMTCQHCVASVQEELGELPGVTDVDVSLETGRVAVTSKSEISEEAASAAVREAGYTVAEWPQE